MATIRQYEKSKKWQAIIKRKGYPNKSKTFRTETEAIQWARGIETEIDKGFRVDYKKAEKITLHDLIDFFLTDFAPFHYRQREDGKEAYKSQCKRLDEVLGEYALAALDKEIVAQYRDDRLKIVGGSTVRKEIFMLSKIMDYGQIERGIVLPQGNPTTLIRKPAEGKGRERRLEAEDLEKVIVQCKKSRNHYLLPAAELAIETSLRQDELLSLTWRDVDLKKGLIVIRESKTDTSDEKGRVVPLSDHGIAVMTSLSVKSAALTGGALDKSALPIPLERMTLYHAFKAAVARAEVKDFTWHDLRHEALSRLGEDGDLSTREMMQMSGHKTVKMVVKYQHADVMKLRKKLQERDASQDKA